MYIRNKYYQHPRDYAQPILDRYFNIYGYLPEFRIARFYNKISLRYGWRSRANRATQSEALNYGVYASGPYVAISFHPTKENLTASAFHGNSSLRTCKHCGDNLAYTVESRIRSYSDQWHWSMILSDFIPEHLAIDVCSNNLCVESRKFIDGSHSLWESAKSLGIKRNRPLRSFRNCPDDLKIVLAAASMLDFEARYHAKKSLLN